MPIDTGIVGRRNKQYKGNLISSFLLNSVYSGFDIVDDSNKKGYSLNLIVIGTN
jgi:hypothetical protein